MVYVNDGSNLKLTESYGVTGSATSKIVYTYAGGKLTQVTDTQGRVITFGYTATPNPTQPTTITDTSLNRVITLAYNGPQGALSKVTDATGVDTGWAYNAQNKLSSFTDGRGNRTDFTYSSGTGKLATLVAGANNATLSGTWKMAYTSSTNTDVTDPQGKLYKYAINGLGQVSTIRDPLLHVTGSTWNTHGDQTSGTNGKGDATTYTVDAAASNPTYNLTKVSSPTGGSGGTGAAGRFGEALFPTALGGGATVDYRPTSVKDAQNATTEMTYNSWGQTVTEVRGRANGTGTPDGGTVTYKYQGSSLSPASCGGRNGQLCQVVDGKGNTTTFTYNAAGNMTSSTPPAGLGAHTYTYDAAGRKVSELDGKGQTAYTCYDKNDRVAQISYTSSNCAAPSGITMTYDAAGNLTSRVSPTGTTGITYDVRNRSTARTETAGAAYGSALTYDRSSNVLTVVSGGSGAPNTTTYRYDGANNPAALAMPGGSCPTTPVFPNSTGCLTFSYSAANERLTTTYPSGVVNTVGYDTSSRPTSITAKNAGGTVLVSRGYTYTASTGPAADTALVQTVTDQAGNATTYGYDAMDRVTAATTKDTGGYTTGTGNWTYDLNGNRTQQVIAGTSLGAAGTTNYGYNAADQLCWSGTGTSGTCTAPGGAATFTYDGQGNQTSAGNSYNNYDQLAGTTTGGALTHTYAGTRNDERFSSGGTVFTNSLLGQMTQETTSGATIKYVRDPAGTLLGMQTSSGNFYYTSDNVGSVLLLTTDTTRPTTAAAYTYDTFGATLTSTGPQAGTNHYRFATGFTESSRVWWRV